MGNTAPLETNEHYPVRFNIEYSPHLSRLTTFFRVILIIPIFFLLLTISGGIAVITGKSAVVLGAGGILFLAPLLMILFRKKYPRWWFDWNVSLVRFGLRVVAYLYCLTDEYPDTEANQKVHFEVDYPDASKLCRGMPLIKWILAIPHFIVLFVLGIIAIFVLILGWLSILFIGRYPRPLFNYMVGFMRWGQRVAGYAILLVTDKYPPFRFSE